jgi:hypothetical protein
MHSRSAHRVPDLQFDAFPTQLDRTRPKLNANSHVMYVLKSPVRELQQEAALAHARVPDDDVLEQKSIAHGDGILAGSGASGASTDSGWALWALPQGGGWNEGSGECSGNAKLQTAAWDWVLNEKYPNLGERGERVNIGRVGNVPIYG